MKQKNNKNFLKTGLKIFLVFSLICITLVGFSGCGKKKKPAPTPPLSDKDYQIQGDFIPNDILWNIE